MVDPTTTNRGYAVPTHGSDVDTWDQPLNSNFDLIDQNMGAVATITLASSLVTLNAAQAACGTIRLIGTPSADIPIIFPAVSGQWVVDNQITGAFDVQLVCTLGGNRTGIPKGVASDVFTDSASIALRNLPEPGSYWDYAGATVPRWVGFCTTPPWLNCDGTVFNGFVYPVLADILGGVTLPDFRGRAPYYLNQGTGRITTAGTGIDGNTRFSSGGTNGLQLTSAYIPTLTSVNATQSITVNPSGKTYAIGTNGVVSNQVTGSVGSPVVPISTIADYMSVSAFTGTNSISVNYTNASPSIIRSTAPGVVSGIRMIRAA